MKSGGEGVKACFPSGPSLLIDIDGDQVSEEFKVRGCEGRVEEVSTSFLGATRQGKKYETGPKEREIYTFEIPMPALKIFEGLPGLIHSLRVYIDLKDVSYIQREVLIGSSWKLLEKSTPAAEKAAERASGVSS